MRSLEANWAMAKQVTQIKVAGYTVGLVGLLDVFEQVSLLDLRDSEASQEELLRRVRAENYVVPGAEEDYKQALWRDYRRWQGEQVEAEEAAGLSIKVLGPGCYACDQLMEDIREVLAAAGVSAELEHVREPSRITDYGLLATPVLVVNGKVKCSGRRPTKRRLESLLLRHSDRIRLQ